MQTKIFFSTEKSNGFSIHSFISFYIKRLNGERIALTEELLIQKNNILLII